MSELFGEDIAGIIGDELGPGLLDATITRHAQGSRTDGSLTAGPADTTSSSTAKGFWEDYTTFQVDGTLVKVGDRRAVILGDTIKPAIVPQQGDEVTMEGTTMRVMRLEGRDPAAATYSLQCRVR
jgi:hypothetical protein